MVTDACGAGNDEAGERSLESIKFMGDAMLANVETICNLFLEPQ
jgi:biuret amidohydrolase